MQTASYTDISESIYCWFQFLQGNLLRYIDDLIACIYDLNLWMTAESRSHWSTLAQMEQVQHLGVVIDHDRNFTNITII